MRGHQFRRDFITFSTSEEIRIKNTDEFQDVMEDENEYWDFPLIWDIRYPLHLGYYRNLIHLVRQFYLNAWINVILTLIIEQPGRLGTFTWSKPFRGSQVPR